MFLHITSHVEGRKNDDLFGTLGGRGFPTFFMLSDDGKVIGQHSGPRSVEGFQKTADTAVAFAEKMKKAEGGDAAAAFEVALGKAKMGGMKVAELKAARKKAGKLTPEQDKEYKGVLAGLQMTEIQRTAVGKAFLKMHKEGVIPTDQGMRGNFYYAIWNYASYVKDLNIMEISLKEMEQALGGNPRAARFLENARAQFEKMKAK